MKMSNSEKYELKQKILKNKYGKYAEKWGKLRCNDDRKIYTNTYHILMEALDNMKEVENNYIQISFSNEYKKTLDVMDNIIKNFERRY